MVRVLHHLALCVALGSLLILWLRSHQLSAATISSLQNTSRVTLLLASLAATLLLAAHGEVLLPEADLFTRITAAMHTWIGQIILVQAVLVAVAWLMVWLTHWRVLPWVLVFISAVLTALRSHVVAAGDVGVLALATVIHIAIAILWLSSIAALVLMSLPSNRQTDFDWRALLRAISSRALPAMLLLLTTGVMLADRTVGTGAAFVATPYGVALMMKLLMVAGALFCAWQLRRWLARTDGNNLALPIRWLRFESGFAVMVVVFAGLIAITIPAAHDVIQWPFSFRIAPVAAYLQRGIEVLWLPLTGAVVFIAALVFALRLRKHSQSRALLMLAAGIVGAAGLSVPALSVDAYPSTYLHSPIPYDVSSISIGERHYQQWCVSCHGEHGRGDGSLASTLRKPPANLTEPHVQWHTHGDLFWWISNGIKLSGMPGFSEQLTEDERWQLLNFLTAMSMGYEARPFSPRIAPKDPWLPAIDFRYTDASGDSIGLSTWREQGKMVLLHFVNDLASQRFITSEDSKCVIVVTQSTATRTDKVAPAISAHHACDVVDDADTQIASAWSHYRRTLNDPDFKNERISLNGMRFLIDRFGFVRARWAADEAAPDAEQFGRMLEQLMNEPEIRSADIHARR
ncbi:MAG: c-type cytochrome [Burkholderiaceae bacterium]